MVFYSPADREQFKESKISIKAIGTGKSPAVSAAVIDLPGINLATVSTRAVRMGSPVKVSMLSGANAANGAGRAHCEQFQSWIGNGAHAAKVDAVMTAAKFTNRGDIDSKMIAGLTYIGAGGNYPKSAASAALSLCSKVFQASARLDKATAEGNTTKIKDAKADFNTVRAGAYKYFNKYVVKDPNPRLNIFANVPRTDV